MYSHFDVSGPLAGVRSDGGHRLLPTNAHLGNVAMPPLSEPYCIYAGIG